MLSVTDEGGTSLPGNQHRTLKVGDILLMGGLPHAWENVYYADCAYVFVTVGATGEVDDRP